MDVGTLTGAISLEDQLTGKLSMMTAKVQQFAENFNGVMGAAAIGAGAITAAVLGAAVSIQKLGEQGSVILGVEASFDRLARTAGSTGDELLGGLNRGVRDTIDSMVLMQATNKLLASGMQLTGKNMETMGSLAREMGKATGEDASNGVRVLSTSLLTGNTMLLKRFGVQVDLKRAEEDFAKSLGVTRKELSSEGVLQARRLGMLTAMQTKLDTLGVSELSFKEKIMQGQIAIGNWVDNLSKAVAASPAVNKALDSIQKAFSDIVGSRSQEALEWIMSWVDRFATGVSAVMPKIVELFDNVKTKITEIWKWLVDFNERWQITSTLISVAKGAWELLQKAFALVESAVQKVIKAWDEMPEWLKKITKGSLEAALALSVYTIAIGAVATPISELFSKLDLGINIIGNLSGAVFNIVSLHGPWHTMTTAMAAKYTLFSAAVASNTVVVWASSVATASTTHAMEIWATVSAGLSGWMTALSAKIGLTTAAQVVQATASKALVGAQALLRAAVFALSLNYMTLTTSIGGSTFALYAQRAAAIAVGTAQATAAAGSVLLGTALLAIKWVIAPLIVGFIAFKTTLAGLDWAGWSEHIEYFALKAQRALGIIKGATDADLWGSVQAGKVRRTGEEAADTMTEAALAAKSAADEAKRLEDALSGKSATDQLDKLYAAYQKLTASGPLAEDAARRFADQVRMLESQGGKANPTLTALREKFDALDKKPDPAGWLGGGASDAVVEFNKKVTDLISTLGGTDEAVKVSEAAFARLFKEREDRQKAGKPSDGKMGDFEFQEDAVAEMDKLLQAGRGLNVQQNLLYDSYLRNASAVRENSMAVLKAQDVTLGAVEAQQAQGESLAHIAMEYGVTVDSLNTYLETLKQATSDEATFAERQRAEFEKTSAIRLAAYEGMMAAEREYADMRMAADGNSVEDQVAKVERELKLELDKLNDLKGMYAENTADYTRQEVARRAIATHTVSVITGNQTTIVERMRAAGIATRADLNKTALDAIRDYSQMKASGVFTAEQVKAAFERAQDAMAAAAGTVRNRWMSALSEIAGALGNMFDGINSKVGQMLSVLGKGIETIADSSKNLGTRLSAGFATAASMLSSLLGEGGGGKLGGAAVGALGGAAAGAGIGFMLGGGPGSPTGLLGAGIGAAAGGIMGALTGWMTAAKKAREENQKATDTIRGYQTELLKTYGSLENVSTIGRIIGVDLAGAWGDQSTAGLKNFSGLLDAFKEKMSQLQTALEKYGLTWKDLNEEMRQMNMTEAAQAILSDFKLLTAAGVAPDTAIKKMGLSLSQLVIDAVETGTKIPAGLQPIITKLIEMGGLTDDAARAMLGLQRDTMPSLADITAAAERYGLKLDELGPKVQQLRINDAAQQIISDYELLIAAGVPFNTLMKDTVTKVTDTGASFDSMSEQAQKAYLDAGGVVSEVTTGMHSSIQDMVTKSLAAGLELPAAMKPIIEQLIAAGGDNGLVDQFGNALTDVTKLNFAADLSGMFETLITKLDELIDKIANGLPGAADAASGIEIEIPYRYTQRGDNPDFESRGYVGGGVVYAANGFVPRGTDTVPAMLTPGERVLTVAENREYERGGGNQFVMAPIMMEGIKVAEALVRTKERYGLGRGRR